MSSVSPFRSVLFSPGTLTKTDSPRNFSTSYQWTKYVVNFKGLAKEFPVPFHDVHTQVTRTRRRSIIFAHNHHDVSGW